MARRARQVVAGVPVHVLWRGHASTAITEDDADRLALLAALRGAASAHGLAVHAFVLMPSHVHLVATAAQPSALSLAMQAVGRTYVRHFNRRHARAGTLWEGRFRSTLLEPGHWVLPCLRYVELNPVRAGLVERPEDYAWSSHRHWIGRQTAAGAGQPWLVPAPDHWALGNTPFEREDRWRAFSAAEPSNAELRRLRQHAHTGWALGSPNFVERLTEALGTPQVPRRPGRPRKQLIPAA